MASSTQHNTATSHLHYSNEVKARINALPEVQRRALLARIDANNRARRAVNLNENHNDTSPRARELQSIDRLMRQRATPEDTSGKKDDRAPRPREQPQRAASRKPSPQAVDALLRALTAQTNGHTPLVAVRQLAGVR